MQEGIEKPKPKVEWQVGELVRVKEGPFTDFNGAVEDVNYDKSKVRVASRSSAARRRSNSTSRRSRRFELIRLPVPPQPRDRRR